MGMQRVLSHKAIKSSGRAECSLEPHSAVTHTHKPGRQSEAVSAQSRGIMAASRDKGGFQGSLYLQKHRKFSDLFRRAHTGQAKVPASRMKGMLLLRPNLNVCPLFAVSPAPQPLSEAQYWYYIVEMSFYVSLLLCVSVDVKRKVSFTVKTSKIKKPHSNICFL